MDANKINAQLGQNKLPEPDQRAAPLQGPPNVPMNFFSSHQQRPHFQQQHPYSQVPQYFDGTPNSFQQFRPPFQQFPPGFQVPNQQSYPVPFQQVYRQQSPVGFPIQQPQQQYVFNVIYINTYF